MEAILKSWKIVNVKSIYKGEKLKYSIVHKILLKILSFLVQVFTNEIPIKNIVTRDSLHLNYLRDFCKFLEEWQISSCAGLTSPTFLACIKIFKALVDCADYLFTRHDFQFVLLGKLSSDPIEARFGWYRQLAGGNFL